MFELEPAMEGIGVVSGQQIVDALKLLNDVGAVCILRGDFNTYTMVIGLIGFIVGVVGCFGFQYMYRRQKERESAKEQENKKQ